MESEIVIIGNDSKISNALPVLDDDVLELIQHYRRVSEACQRRESILKHATLEYAWSPGTKNSIGTLVDLIVRVPTVSAIPFHNDPPWEIFSFNGKNVRVGMWEDRSNLIYLFAEDVQSWNHVVHIPIGSKLFFKNDIRCKRLRHKKKWISC